MEFIVNAEKRDRKGTSSSRNIRREGMDLLKNLLKNKEISEDNNTKLSNELQQITDKFISEVDKKISEKEQEIIKV